MRRKTNSSGVPNAPVATARSGAFRWSIVHATFEGCATVADILGFPVDVEPHGLSVLLSQVHPEDLPRVQEHIRQGIEGRRGPGAVQVRYRHPDGGLRHLFISVVIDASEDVLSGVMVDLTAFREVAGRAHKQEAELALVHQRMVRAQDELDRVQRLEGVGLAASALAHDLNNLLSVILGNLPHLLTGADEGADRDALVREVDAAARRAGGLTERLMQLGREAPSQLERVDLAELVADQEALLRATSRPGDVVVDLEIAAGPLWVEARRGELEGVVLNLVLNAVQAMPDGGIVDVHLTRQDGSAVLLVRDTGVGMSSAIQARVFEPLFTTRTDGTGIGLALVRRCVDEMGGHISVRSKPGVGSAFEVVLPLREEAEPRADRLRAARVLLLGSDPALQAFLASTLERRGVVVLREADLHADGDHEISAVIAGASLAARLSESDSAGLEALCRRLPVLYLEPDEKPDRVGQAFCERVNAVRVPAPLSAERMLGTLARTLVPPTSAELDP